MENKKFTSIEEVDDISSLDAYKVALADGVTEERALYALGKLSRDNARTPYQWDDTENAGFGTGTPWLPVNPNYKEINLAAQKADPDSVYNYYKKLIELRHTYDIIVYGHYELQMAEDPELFIYTRELDRH